MYARFSRISPAYNYDTPASGIYFLFLRILCFPFKGEKAEKGDSEESGGRHDPAPINTSPIPTAI